MWFKRHAARKVVLSSAFLTLVPLLTIIIHSSLLSLKPINTQFTHTTFNSTLSSPTIHNIHKQQASSSSSSPLRQQFLYLRNKETHLMGNISSCFCISNSVTIETFNARLKGKKTAMLLDTDRSTIREIKLPVKSAELMIEAIGHVITPMEELRRTRRITALRADEELLDGNVYLLVPVCRINSKASEFEITIAEKLSGKRKGIKTAKVSPSISRSTESDGENEVVNFPPVCPTSTQRMGNQRRWNPVLDPISESS